MQRDEGCGTSSHLPAGGHSHLGNSFHFDSTLQGIKLGGGQVQLTRSFDSSVPGRQDSCCGSIRWTYLDRGKPRQAPQGDSTNR